ncbi:MAG: J domain-containing protein [Chloroflexi bacterium]|nr:J domain-containing protein [Chloroflexota bacterium]
MASKVNYDPQHDYYELLGTAVDADAATIQRAYRQRAKALHPDVNQERSAWAKDQFQALNEAYSVLSDPERRYQYNSARYAYYQAAYHLAREQTRITHVTEEMHYPYQDFGTYRDSTHDSYGTAPVGAAPAPHGSLLAAVSGLMRGPYRYLLLVLVVMLVVGIIAILLLGNWFESLTASGDEETAPIIVATTQIITDGGTGLGGEIAIPTTTPFPTITPTIPLQEASACETYFQIEWPVSEMTLVRTDLPQGAVLRGRVINADVATFEVRVMSNQLDLDVVLWTEVVLPEAALEDDVLAQLAPLANLPSGTYTLIVRGYDPTGMLLGQCAIILNLT